MDPHTTNKINVLHFFLWQEQNECHSMPNETLGFGLKENSSHS